MNPFLILLVVALTFGICYGLDKGYTRLFRGEAQHRTGLQVRVNKRYASFGLILCVLGVLAIFTGMGGESVLLIGGIVVILIGCGLIGYYMSYGIFYDGDSFITASFPKGSRTYRFGDIHHQKLYLIQGGSTVIELHMTDGTAVSIQSAMDGAYPFLDHAFNVWCQQTGRDPSHCDFHDPRNHLWFPGEEDA